MTTITKRVLSYSVSGHGCKITLYVDCVLCLLQKVFVILAVAVVVVMIIVSIDIPYGRKFLREPIFTVFAVD